MNEEEEKLPRLKVIKKDRQHNMTKKKMPSGVIEYKK